MPRGQTSFGNTMVHDGGHSSLEIDLLGLLDVAIGACQSGALHHRA
jgi:hypothetical protein